jgi:hypothetical protein
MLQRLRTIVLQASETMYASRFDPRHRPRELRRRVVLPARLRHGGGWSDACILNVSSRGLMIQSGRPSRLGGVVELCRGAYLLQAKVVWQDGLRTGLQVDEALPIEDILALGQSPGPHPMAADSRLVDRRRTARGAEASRWRGRAIEFGGTAFIAVALCAATLAMLEEAFARPMSLVERALDL